VVLPPIVTATAPDPSDVAAVRAGLHLGDDEMLVVGCGEVHPRKGPDHFVELAARLSPTRAVRFAWIGRRIRPHSTRLDHDVAMLGLEASITWTGDLPSAGPWLGAADVVVVPSRSDPLPLVPLEAALAGTATVAFRSDGLADLADAEVVTGVPYPDGRALAAAVDRLLDDPTARADRVRTAQAWISSHQAPEVAVPRFVSLLRELTERGRS
jgi:glycosyltransferase involved in cell wall biosynthesis